MRLLAAALFAAASIHVPAGYRVGVYASGLEQPTAMAFAPDGRLAVAQTGGSIVWVERGRRPRLLAGRFATPLGVVWDGRDLYVSSTGKITLLRTQAGRVTGRRAIVSRLPHKLHQQDNIVLGPDGRLYFGNGSTCDACRERDRRSATILSVERDGRGLRIVATGLRNAFGLAFKPGTSELYASVNGRDHVDEPGDPEPAEMLVRVEQGDDFGWPDCWPSARLLRLVGACHGVTPPVAYLEPHSSADGFAFWRGAVYLAEWGTYLKSSFGKRVVRIQGSNVTVFASGFVHPLAVAVDPAGGGLLVADWGTGVIYEITRR